MSNPINNFSEANTHDPWIVQRFIGKIKTDENTDCWIWTAGKSTGGYGNFKVNNIGVCAHRFSYVMAFGVIPEGLILHHKCKNPACVNPYHLESLTFKEHSATMNNFEKSRTHCPKGHEYTKENTRINKHKDGGYARQCRQCCSDRRWLEYWSNR